MVSKADQFALMTPVPHRPSLVALSADHLRRILHQGEWQGVLPSERILCRRLGISRPTLRAALSLLEKDGTIGAVSDKRRAVLTASDRPLETSVNHVVSLISPVPTRLMPPFVLFWLDALRALLADAGLQLHVHTLPAAAGSRPATALARTVEVSPSAAWIVFRSTPQVQRWFAEHRLPVVVAGSTTDEVALPSVDIDYRAACRHAAALLRRRKHVRAALLLPLGNHGGDVVSEAGFIEGWQDESTGLIIRHEDHPDGLVEAVDQVLGKRDRPSAFLVARSANALTLVTHLLRLRHRLPQDFAVISRDDDAFLSHVVPRVTRYAADPAKFARKLASLVVETVQNGKPGSKPLRLMPELIPGETV